MTHPIKIHKLNQEFPVITEMVTMSEIFKLPFTNSHRFPKHLRQFKNLAHHLRKWRANKKLNLENKNPSTKDHPSRKG